MTTSISTKETEQFEEFLQSLDEINNYLDKKLKDVLISVYKSYLLNLKININKNKLI